MALSWLWALPLLGLLPWGLNRAIRHGLAAPRVRETGSPEGLPWQAVVVPTRNGKQLFGWFIPAAPRAPALVVMHGWGGNAEMMLPLAAPLHQAGYTLLLMDARCHGGSDDDSFASLPRFAEDIEAGLAWLGDQSGVDASRLGIVGHSVGAGAALLAASRISAVRAVVSLAAFAHPATMMKRWLAGKRIPYWPLGAYILRYVQRVIGYRFDDIAPVRTISSIGCPVMLIHGQEDEIVPLADAEAIHAAGTPGRVQLLAVAGSHDDYGDIERSLAVVTDFLSAAFSESPAAT